MIRKSRSLRLEALEDRCVLAASLLVRFNDGATPFAVAGASLQAEGLVSGLYSVRLDSNDTSAALAAYRADQGVAYAEADSSLTESWIPNDTQIKEQWGMNNTGQTAGGRKGVVGADINAGAAWGVVTGSRRTVVAVLDSGINYTHADLYRNIWVNQGEIPASRKANLKDVDGDGLITMNDLNFAVNQGVGKITDLNRNGYIDADDLLTKMNADGTGGWADGTSNDGDKYVDDIVGWNFVANNNRPLDDYGHGTAVAGVVGATGNNGLGVAGVAWAVQLMPVKFFDANGTATTSNYVAALQYSLAKGARISVNSFEDSGYSQAMSDAVKQAWQAGQVYVAAAGNGGHNTDTTPNYPSGYSFDNVVSVGATDVQDKLSSASNYGKASVDIAAPGIDVMTTAMNGGYRTASGTSFSAPHVAGVAALVLSLRPEWNYRQVINQVLGTGDPLASLTGKVAFGRLDAYAAIKVPPRNGPQPSSTVVNGYTPSNPGGSGGGGMRPSEIEESPVAASGPEAPPEAVAATPEPWASSLFVAGPTLEVAPLGAPVAFDPRREAVHGLFTEEMTFRVLVDDRLDLIERLMAPGRKADKRNPFDPETW